MNDAGRAVVMSEQSFVAPGPNTTVRGLTRYTDRPGTRIAPEFEAMRGVCIE